MRYKTIEEATRVWVSEMNQIPQEVVRKLREYSQYCDINEVTPVAKYDRVWSNDHQEMGTVTEVNYETEVASVEFDGQDEATEVELSDISTEYDYDLPIWGTMWSFGDSCDDYWLEEKDGLQKMAECGFRVFESEDYGYVFGIDGAGYDFYESHWIPLYKARGLQWHDTESEGNANE